MKSSSLNHVYRIVWNAVLGLWQVASEVSRGRGKTGTSQQQRRVRRQAGALALAALGGLGAQPALAAGLPTGGVVVAGQAGISQSGNTLNISQATDKAAIDWQSFNVGKGNTVNFQQPSSSSVALNRVLGNDVSVIQGAINANGQVFLVNQSGVLFTPTAQVNVGGLVASTQNISTEDFLAGKYQFSGGSTAGIENQGSLKAGTGGTVALIAAKIINSGSIEALKGTVGLAAANTVLVDLGGPVKIQVSEGALNTLIEQGGGIRADGGRVYLTAKAAGNLAASVINHTGITQARTLATGEKGEIVLLADMGRGTTKVAGTLDASAPDAGDGGFIETSAAKVKVADGVHITTKSAQGQAGTWLIDPVDFTIAATGGDLSGATLSNILSVVDVKIQTTSSGASCPGVPICGPGTEGNGDIHVNDAVAWSSPAKLTLSAYRNVNINADITATGPAGKLALEVGQGSSDGADSDYFIKAGNKVNLQAGDNFILKKGSTGATNIYKVITQLGTANDAQLLIPISPSLQGLASTTQLTGKYVLGADIDASGAMVWNNFAGFTPIGGSTAFSGQFHGLGHTISALSINRSTTSGVGLFGVISGDAMVRDLGLVNASVKGNFSAGALAGALTGNGTVKNVYVAGGTVSGDGFVGGLIGSSGASIQNAHADIAVSGRVQVGGLVGSVSNGALSNVYAEGNVTAQSSGAGGLVGLVQGSAISISNAYATGNVSSPSEAGGLVGSVSSISDTDVITISNAYASGSVSAPGESAFGTGGLVGRISGDQMSIGGSVLISNTYVTGEVLGSGISSGALVGLAQYQFAQLSISNSFWDTSTVNASQLLSSLPAVGGNRTFFNGLATVTQTNVSGKTTAELKDKATFANAGWSIAGAGGAYPTLRMDGSGTVWQIGANTSPVYISLTCGLLCNNTYGDNVTLNFGAFDALVNGTLLTDAALSGTATYSVVNASNQTVSDFGSLTDAGTYTITYTGGLTAGNEGYIVNPGSSVTWTVNPRTLTVELTGTESNPLGKVYDGNANLALTGSNFSLGNFVGAQGQGAVLAGVNMGRFNSKNVLEATTLSADLSAAMLTLGGDINTANYKLPSSVSTTAVIKARELGVTGLSAQSKVYDGQLTASLLGTAQLVSAAVVADDMVQLSGSASGVFTDKDVGIGKSIVLGGLELQGSDASNYAIAKPALVANITPKELTIAGSTVTSKAYDGTTTASVSVGTLSGLVDGETLGQTKAMGEFADKNAVSNQDVAVTYTLVDGMETLTKAEPICTSESCVSTFPTSLTNTAIPVMHATPGAKASNYSLAGETLKGSITKRDVTVSGIAASGKTYDGNTNATISKVGTLSNEVAGETLGLNTTGSFDNKNAGERTVSTLTTISDSATALASNYNLTHAENSVGAVIAKRDVTVSGIVVSGKTYDGNTKATISKVGTLSNEVSGETLGLDTTGSFGSKNAGVRTVSTQTTISDSATALADNYNLTNASGSAEATISQKALTVSGIVASDKVYDGTRDAQVSATNVLFDGLVENDHLLVSEVSGQFSDKHVGSDKTVSLSTLYKGEDLDNYLITDQGTATADITARKITGVTGLTAKDKVYDGTRTAAFSLKKPVLTNMIEGDDLSLLASGATFADANVGVNKIVSLTDAELTGRDAGNYVLPPVISTKASIEQRGVTVSGIKANDKVYNGTTLASLNTAGRLLDGVVSGETLGVSASGAFEDKNVGKDKQVAVHLSLTGAGASNYKLLNTTLGTTASITPRSILRVDGLTAKDKVYDGTTTARVTLGEPVLVNMVAGDDLSLLTTGAEFSDANAGLNKAVVLKGAELSGIDAGNYVLPAVIATKATIEQRGVTVSGIKASDKVYNATKNVALDASGRQLDGVLSKDAPGVFATGAFADKHVGQDKEVTVALRLTGAGSTNYKLLNTTLATTASITPRAISQVSGVTAADKVYDGSTLATLDLSKAAFNTLIAGDELSLASATGKFSSASAGVGKGVSVSQLVLGGADAGNYSVPALISAKATIEQRGVTASGIKALDKVYNGTKVAGVDISKRELTGVLEGETLGLLASGAFEDKNAGDDKKVTVDLRLTGTGFSNYKLLNATQDLKASITPLSISRVDGVTAANKVYDGSTSATLDLSKAVFSSLIAGDKLTLASATGKFSNANAGVGKTVSLTDTVLGGADAGNYVLPALISAKATIDQREVTVSGIKANDKEYNGTKNASLDFSKRELDGVLMGETLGLYAAGEFADKNAGDDKQVNVSLRLTGAGSFNYKLASDKLNLTADITQKLITKVSGIKASDKEFDGTTVAFLFFNQPVLEPVLSGDDVRLLTAGASYADAAVGTNKVVTLDGVKLAGLDGKNYRLAGPVKTTASILPAAK